MKTRPLGFKEKHHGYSNDQADHPRQELGSQSIRHLQVLPSHEEDSRLTDIIRIENMAYNETPTTSKDCHVFQPTRSSGSDGP